MDVKDKESKEFLNFQKRRANSKADSKPSGPITPFSLKPLIRTRGLILLLIFLEHASANIHKSSMTLLSNISPISVVSVELKSYISIQKHIANVSCLKINDRL